MQLMILAAAFLSRVREAWAAESNSGLYWKSSKGAASLPITICSRSSRASKIHCFRRHSDMENVSECSKLQPMYGRMKSNVNAVSCSFSGFVWVSAARFQAFYQRLHCHGNTIDYSEKDVWEVLKRHWINPHPCYRAGWNRCSCATCIFFTPKLFAGIRELYPEEYQLLNFDEEILGFTLDNKCNLDTFVGEAKFCVYHGDEKAIQSLITGEFSVEDIYVEGKWMYPAGAFHGAEGGPC